MTQPPNLKDLTIDDSRDIKDDPKEVYYVRLHLLVVKHATYVLRCKFDQLIPPDQLHTALNSKKNISRISHAFSKNIINERQKSRLHSTSGPPKSQDFDISILMFLLRNICDLDTKSPWWKCEDNSKIPIHNKDVIADIVRLRNLRNKLHHTPTASLEEDEFESEWSLTEEVMIRLTEQCGIPGFKQTIDDVKFSKLDLVSNELKNIIDDRKPERHYYYDYHDDYEEYDYDDLDWYDHDEYDHGDHDDYDPGDHDDYDPGDYDLDYDPGDHDDYDPGDHDLDYDPGDHGLDYDHDDYGDDYD